MKFAIAVALALSLPALAQPRNQTQSNAIPTQSDFPLNPHKPGRSVRLVVKEPAPYSGRLIEDQEHARREWLNERTAGELAALKRDRGARFLTVPAIVALVAGSLAVGIGVGIGIDRLTR